MELHLWWGWFCFSAPFTLVPPRRARAADVVLRPTRREARVREERRAESVLASRQTVECSPALFVRDVERREARVRKKRRADGAKARCRRAVECGPAALRVCGVERREARNREQRRADVAVAQQGRAMERGQAGAGHHDLVVLHVVRRLPRGAVLHVVVATEVDTRDLAHVARAQRLQHLIVRRSGRQHDGVAHCQLLRRLPPRARFADHQRGAAGPHEVGGVEQLYLFPWLYLVLTAGVRRKSRRRRGTAGFGAGVGVVASMWGVFARRKWRSMCPSAISEIWF